VYAGALFLHQQTLFELGDPALILPPHCHRPEIHCKTFQMVNMGGKKKIRALFTN
jgi:hypothetical protein